MKNIRIYIDGANLHQALKQFAHTADYRKIRIWLSQKYQTQEIFLFLGRIPNNANLYTQLQAYGYRLVFKETITTREKVKGNCDAELVLHVVSDYYLKKFDMCILITGDGDFACLVGFLQERAIAVVVIAPHRKNCSYLLRSRCRHLVYLNEHYHKFYSDCTPKKEKTPDTDASA